MTINWFPGHMHKARREIGKAMPRVSLIMEILDARIPFSSENPLVAELRGDTPCIKVLNKSDLADPQATRAWLTHFEQIPGVTAIALDARQAGRVKSLPELGRRLLPGDRSPGKPVTTMILGIPNVGKSTLINTLAGRSIAKTGNVPAVTRAQQRIKISDHFVLLDTPGFLWPKMTPQECGYRLAVTGAIRDAVIEYEDIAFFAAKYLLERYPDALAQRYDLEVIPEDEM
ncbi:MAG: ribosome biogenesis GTPase YlqF, partial [Myxococcota bacterium]|nr:ribosome biogenesis GTPase YlqF [Myxococcota bacterium]